MRILILGTKGIPNRYGGFEAFAEILSAYLAHRGHSVCVFEPTPKGVNLEPLGAVERAAIPVPAFLPQNIRTVYYDYQSLRVAYSLNPDAILCCGHTASAFYRLLPKDFRRRIVTNMDGLEWARPKWGLVATAYLRLTERMATSYSGHIVADSQIMAKYLQKKYGCNALYIPYGAIKPTTGNKNNATLYKYGLEENSFGLCIARIEPENQLELAIKAFIALKKTIVIVAPTNSTFAKKLRRRYSKYPGIIFLGAIYNRQELECLRQNAAVYYHGHTVGGTNPSLLDAMACGCNIVAHRNDFNMEVMGIAGSLFSNPSELEEQIGKVWESSSEQRTQQGNLAIERVQLNYRWDSVTDEYLKLFERIKRIGKT